MRNKAIRHTVDGLWTAGFFSLLAASFVGVPAAAWAQDPYPYQAITFFNTQSCPSGWQTHDLLNGRFIVPVMQNGGIGQTVGTPLTSGEDRQHQHSFASSISLNGVEYIGAASCCNQDLSSDGTMNFSGTTASVSSGIPYVQLLVCMKTDYQPGPGDIPSGLVSFLVGLPANGAPAAAFGGDPLGSAEDRTHAHSVSGSVSTTSQVVALASGCFIFCATSYGANQTYNYSATTGEASTGLPYMQLLQCQKN
jgi:hypothetical protein